MVSARFLLAAYRCFRYLVTLSIARMIDFAVSPMAASFVQDFDQSIVIFRLDLKPGDVVVESGTGSGVMSSVSYVHVS